MRRIKKFCLLLAVVTALVLPAAAFAASGDTLAIGGVVPLTLDLAVTPDANADQIVLVGAGVGVNANIATIAINTNNAAGWELWVSSSTADGLGSYLQIDASNQISYTITYTGTGGVASTAITNAGLKVGEEAAPNAAEAGTLSITYDQSNAYAAGYYADLLTVTLRAK